MKLIVLPDMLMIKVVTYACIYVILRRSTLSLCWIQCTVSSTWSPSETAFPIEETFLPFPRVNVTVSPHVNTVTTSFAFMIIALMSVTALVAFRAETRLQALNPRTDKTAALRIHLPALSFPQTILRVTFIDTLRKESGERTPSNQRIVTNCVMISVQDSIYSELSKTWWQSKKVLYSSWIWRSSSTSPVIDILRQVVPTLSVSSQSLEQKSPLLLLLLFRLPFTIRLNWNFYDHNFCRRADWSALISTTTSIVRSILRLPQSYVFSSTAVNTAGKSRHLSLLTAGLSDLRCEVSQSYVPSKIMKMGRNTEVRIIFFIRVSNFLRVDAGMVMSCPVPKLLKIRNLSPTSFKQ